MTGDEKTTVCEAPPGTPHAASIAAALIARKASIARKKGIPIIDLQRDDAEVAACVRDACLASGFFLIENHGVDASLIERTFSQNAAFFALPTAEKLKLRADGNFRGYTPMQDETLDPSAKAGDTKEGIYFGRERPADDPEPLAGPNQWPSEELVPEYRGTTEAYIEALSGLGLRLVRLIALALHLPKHHSDPHFTEPMVFMKPLRYDGRKSSEARGIYGAGAHTDYGMITILKTSQGAAADGLQVNLDGEWRDVISPPGCFVVNLGDMLERWTNGIFRSTLHRVMGNGRERHSIPFFYQPNFYTEVSCLPGCSSEAYPAKYSHTTSGQHILDKYAQTYASNEVVANFLKHPPRPSPGDSEP